MANMYVNHHRDKGLVNLLSACVGLHSDMLMMKVYYNLRYFWDVSREPLMNSRSVTVYEARLRLH